MNTPRCGPESFDRGLPRPSRSLRPVHSKCLSRVSNCARSWPPPGDALSIVSWPAPRFLIVGMKRTASPWMRAHGGPFVGDHLHSLGCCFRTRNRPSETRRPSIGGFADISTLTIVSLSALRSGDRVPLFGATHASGIKASQSWQVPAVVACSGMNARISLSPHSMSNVNEREARGDVRLASALGNLPVPHVRLAWASSTDDVGTPDDGPRLCFSALPLAVPCRAPGRS